MTATDQPRCDGVTSVPFISLSGAKLAPTTALTSQLKGQQLSSFVSGQLHRLTSSLQGEFPAKNQQANPSPSKPAPLKENSGALQKEKIVLKQPYHWVILGTSHLNEPIKLLGMFKCTFVLPK